MFVLTILRNNLHRLWLTDTAKPPAGRGGLAAVPALAGLARAVLLTGLTAVLLGFGGAARAELDKALIRQAGLNSPLRTSWRIGLPGLMASRT